MAHTKAATPPKKVKPKKKKKPSFLDRYIIAEEFNSTDVAIMVFVGAWFSISLGSWLVYAKEPYRPSFVIFLVALHLLCYMIVTLGLCKSLHDLFFYSASKLVQQEYHIHDTQQNVGVKQPSHSILKKAALTIWILRQKKSRIGSGVVFLNPPVWVIIFVIVRIFEIAMRTIYSHRCFRLGLILQDIIDLDNWILPMGLIVLFVSWYKLSERMMDNNRLRNNIKMASNRNRRLTELQNALVRLPSGEVYDTLNHLRNIWHGSSSEEQNNIKIIVNNIMS